MLVREGPSKGLLLSTSATSPKPKSTVWQAAGPGRQRPNLANIPTLNTAGTIVLGAPVGSPDFVREALETKVEKVEEITALLPNLEDPHFQFTLLRACLSLPKLAFMLRAVDTTTFRDTLEAFDSITREALTRIIGGGLSEQQWLQARLPVHLGGMGLRGAVDHASASHISSLLASETLVNQLLGKQDGGEEEQLPLPQALLDDLTARQGEEATIETLTGVTQKMISKKIDQTNLQSLKSQLDDAREVARLTSLGLPHSGAWLTSPPIPALGLHLSPVEFSLAAKYRLGCPVYDSAGPCPACQRPSDILGDHALCCSAWGERIARHNLLRDHLHSMAASACLNPVKEGRHLLPGEQRRPADVLIPCWEGGKDAAIDVTVVNPLQQEFVEAAAATAGYALQQAYNRKMAGAAEACASQGLAFLPMAVESFGGWEERAVKQVRKLASALARQSGQEEWEAERHAFTRLSILLQKGNATILANRFRREVPASTDGVMEGDG